MKMRDALQLYDVLTEDGETHMSPQDVIDLVYEAADDPDEAALYLDQDVYAAEGGIYALDDNGYIDFNRLLWYVPERPVEAAENGE